MKRFLPSHFPAISLPRLISKVDVPPPPTLIYPPTPIDIPSILTPPAAAAASEVETQINGKSEVQKPNPPTIYVAWDPPPSRLDKINMDVSVHHSKTVVVVAGFFRDSHGNLIFPIDFHDVLEVNPLDLHVAELTGILRSVKGAIMLGRGSIMVETSHGVAVDVFDPNYEFYENERGQKYFDLYSDVVDAARYLDDLAISHTPSKVNKLANLAARYRANQIYDPKANTLFRRQQFEFQRERFIREDKAGKSHPVKTWKKVFSKHVVKGCEGLFPLYD